jgi:hypothetical protein
MVQHAFREAGTYRVEVQVTSGGSTGTVSLPIRVFPQLTPAIARSGPAAVAVVRGGDGHPLYERWRLPDGRESYGPAAELPRAGVISLTVVDGTGTMTTVTADAAALPSAPPPPKPDPPFVGVGETLAGRPGGGGSGEPAGTSGGPLAPALAGATVGQGSGAAVASLTMLAMALTGGAIGRRRRARGPVTAGP